jgi:uncharacterized C2H2 Zn-finger protein
MGKRQDFSKLSKMLELIQADVDGLTRDERVAFQIECGVFGGMAEGFAGAIRMMQQPEVAAHLPKDALAKYTRESWDTLRKDMKGLRAFVEVLATLTNKAVFVEFPVMSRFQWSTEEGFSCVEAAHQESVPVRFYARAQGDNLMGGGKKYRGMPTVVKLPKGSELCLGQPFISLVRAFEGLPLDRLLKCPHCGKVFVQETERPKTYCSPRCRTAVGVARHRARQRNTTPKKEEK